MYLRNSRRKMSIHSALAVGLVFAALAPAGFAAEPLEFNRDIRPILADNCFACHGPDSASRKAGLRLDKSEDAVKAKAIIPGKPAESAMIVRINSDDPAEHMPPAKTNKK